MKRRLTKNKLRILKLFNDHHILSVPMIEEKLPDIDPSTIYRNIKRFESDGHIKEINIGFGAAQYELAHYDHYHFVCQDCNSVVALDVTHEELACLLPENYQVSSIHFHAQGQCQDCCL